MRRIIGLLFLLVALFGMCAYSFLTGGRAIPSQHGYSIKGTETIVMTHGGLANAESMLAWAYAFSDQGYDVTLLDLPNHGDWYTDLIRFSAANQNWQNIANQSAPKMALGHSLGGSMVARSAAPIRIRIGSGKRGEKGNYYGNSFPLYIIDHVLEPWNPILIKQVLQDVQISIDEREEYAIWGYCLLPWISFVFGLGGGILVLPAARRRLTQMIGLETQSRLYTILVSALFLIVIFWGVTFRSLWNTLPISVAEVAVFSGCGMFALMISRLVSKHSSVFSSILVWIWCIMCPHILAQIWTFWPGPWLMELHSVLMIVVAVITFTCSRCISLESAHEKDMTGVLLFSYALAVLTPKIGFV